MSNDKIRDGLVPQTVTRKDGVQTTVYVRPDDGNSGADNVSGSLKNRSVLATDEKPAFNPKDMTISTVSDANALADELENDPTAFYDEATRERAADALATLDAKASAEKWHKDHLKGRVLAMFTENQIERGEMKSDESGRYFVEVADEPTRFDARRAELTAAEAAECSESSLNHSLIQSKFPDTWNEIGKCTGGVYARVEHSDARNHMTDKFSERIESNSQRNLGKRPTQKQVISEFIRSMDRVDKAEEDKTRLRNAVAAAAVPEEDREKFASRPASAADDYMNKEYAATTFSNPKSGASFSVKPNMTYDTGSFVESRYEHYQDQLVERNPNISDTELHRKAQMRAQRDWTKVNVLKVRADKVKEKYPEKYQRGRTTREMYINE